MKYFILYKSEINYFHDNEHIRLSTTAVEERP